MASAQIMRMILTAGSQDMPQDISTSATPVVWNGTDLSFPFLLQNSDGSIMDVSTVVSVTLEVKDPISKTSAPFITGTVTSASINPSVALADFEAGTAQHGTINFSGSNTRLPMAGDSTAYWLVWSATLASNAQIVFGAGNITFNESGFDTPPPPATVTLPTYLTVAMGDARYEQTIDVTQIWRGISAATGTAAQMMPASGGTFTGAVVIGTTLSIPTNALNIAAQASGPINTGTPAIWIAVTATGSAATGNPYYIPLYQ